MGAIETAAVRPIVTYRRTGPLVRSQMQPLSTASSVHGRIDVFQGGRFEDGALVRDVAVATIRPQYTNIYARYAAQSEAYTSWLSEQHPDAYRALRGSATIDARLAPVIARHTADQVVMRGVERFVETNFAPTRLVLAFDLLAAGMGGGIAALSAYAATLPDGAVIGSLTAAIGAGFAGMGLREAWLVRRERQWNSADLPVLDLHLAGARTYLEDFLMTPGNEAAYRDFMVNFVPQEVRFAVEQMQHDHRHMQGLMTSLQEGLPGFSQHPEYAEWQARITGLGQAVESLHTDYMEPLELWLQSWEIYANENADNLLRTRTWSQSAAAFGKVLDQATERVAAMTVQSRLARTNAVRLLADIKELNAAVLPAHQALALMEAGIDPRAQIDLTVPADVHKSLGQEQLLAGMPAAVQVIEDE